LAGVRDNKRTISTASTGQKFDSRVVEADRTSIVGAGALAVESFLFSTRNEQQSHQLLDWMRRTLLMVTLTYLFYAKTIEHRFYTSLWMRSSNQ